jgi:hypothetical protein
MSFGGFSCPILKMPKSANESGLSASKTLPIRNCAKQGILMALIGWL